MLSIVIVYGFLSSSCVSVKSFSNPDLNITGKTLGVLPFDCRNERAGMLMSDFVGSNILDSGFKIIERTHLAKILEEHGLSQSGITRKSDYKRIGQIANLDYLLIGNIQFFGNTEFIWLTTARIIDAVTGQVILSVTYECSEISEFSVINKVGEKIGTAIKEEIAKNRGTLRISRSEHKQRKSTSYFK
jgi:curli biogenesis system outer membrane secretion channel CsgG